MQLFNIEPYTASKVPRSHPRVLRGLELSWCPCHRICVFLKLLVTAGSHRMEQELDSAGSTRDAQEEAEQPNSAGLISHLHLCKGFISQSDFIFRPESKRKLTGVWVGSEEINSYFHPLSLL